MAGVRPSEDPNSTKFPDKRFYSGRWRTDEEIKKRLASSRELYANDYSRRESIRKQRRDRYATDASYREMFLERDRRRRADPDFRRKKTLYMMDYGHRRKHERWADQGLTLRNDGEEGSASGDRAAA